MFVLSLLACTATLQINAPDDANIYVSKTPMSDNEEPSFYEAKGTGDTVVYVNYWAWEKYYVWAGGPGYEAEVRAIPNELKIGPLIVGICLFWPALVWVSGPTEMPIEMDPDKIGQPARATGGAPR